MARGAEARAQVGPPALLTWRTTQRACPLRAAYCAVGAAAFACMRLALGSDLHVDTWPGAKLRWHEAPEADVLLLAGDLHDDQAGSAAVLRKAAEVRITWQ